MSAFVKVLLGLVPGSANICWMVEELASLSWAKELKWKLHKEMYQMMLLLVQRLSATYRNAASRSSFAAPSFTPCNTSTINVKSSSC